MRTTTSNKVLPSSEDPAGGIREKFEDCGASAVRIVLRGPKRMMCIEVATDYGRILDFREEI